MSVAKSVTAGCLIGAAIQDGHIGSLDDPVTRYLPQLAGSAYEGVTTRQLLQMASGVQWDESYTKPCVPSPAHAQVAEQPEAGGDIEIHGSVAACWPSRACAGTTARAKPMSPERCCARPSASRSLNICRNEFGPSSAWRPTPPGGWNCPTDWRCGAAGLSAVLRDYGRFGLFLLDKGGGAASRCFLKAGYEWQAIRSGSAEGPTRRRGLLGGRQGAGFRFSGVLRRARSLEDRLAMKRESSPRVRLRADSRPMVMSIALRMIRETIAS